MREQQGAVDAVDVAANLNVIVIPVADLPGSDYAISVHETAHTISTPIACGTSGGIIEQGEAGDDIRFPMHELNGSGHPGSPSSPVKTMRPGSTSCRSIRRR